MSVGFIPTVISFTTEPLVAFKASNVPAVVEFGELSP